MEDDVIEIKSEYLDQTNLFTSTSMRTSCVFISFLAISRIFLTANGALFLFALKLSIKVHHITSSSSLLHHYYVINSVNMKCEDSVNVG